MHFRLHIFALTVGLIAACSSSKDQRKTSDDTTPAAAPAAPATATPAEDARQLAAAGAPVIDVRSQEEWDEGHLASAKLIPVDQFQGRIAEVDALVNGDKSKPVVVVCRSGGRAGKAREMLLAAGYSHVVNGGRWENLK
jgi:phage shock protein E